MRRRKSRAWRSFTPGRGRRAEASSPTAAACSTSRRWARTSPRRRRAPMRRSTRSAGRTASAAATSAGAQWSASRWRSRSPDGALSSRAQRSTKRSGVVRCTASGMTGRSPHSAIAPCGLQRLQSAAPPRLKIMPDLADLYPGFASRFMPTSIGTIFVRTGGTGPPLLLLHGYPQTNVIYHRVAPRLAQGFTLVIPDLPGYGWSAVPRSDADHTPYTKRAMAAVMIELMEALGFVRFRIAGHDRGGRVAYRLALDHPERVERLAALDILPTYDYWQRMDRLYGLKMYHWLFLAQPEPLPERLIGGNPVFNVVHPLASWTKAQSLAAFDPRALAHYRAALADPSRIHAACEDYRAGAHADYDHDAADRA